MSSDNEDSVYWPDREEMAKPLYVTNIPEHVPDEEQLQFDAQIIEVEAYIRGLKRQRNSRSPVACLPPELLAKIFLVLSEDPYKHQKLSSPNSWIRFTHVSQQWRQTALASPRLWTRICLWYPSSWVDLMLERSCTAPLDAEASFQDFLYALPPSFNKVIQEAQRLRSFNLHAESFHPNAAEVLRSGLTSPMPILETFTLGSTEVHTTHDVLSIDFLGGNAPNLKSLTLGKWGLVDWTSPAFRKLTTLTIIIDSVSHPTLLSTILDGIEGMPELTNLMLHMTATGNDLDHPRRPTVRLPNLQLLQVYLQTVDHVAILLGHLALPSSTRIWVASDIDSREHTSPAALKSLAFSLTSSWLSDPLSPSNLAQPRSLSSLFISDWRDNLTIKGWFNPLGLDWDSYPFFEGESELQIGVVARNAQLIFLNNLPLRGLVEFSSHGDLDVSIFPKVGAMELLESLSLTRGGARAFFGYLETNGEHTSPMSFLPSLAFLSIGEVQFSDDRRWDRDQDPFLEIVSQRGFVRFLRARATSEKTIAKVVLKKCGRLAQRFVEDIRSLCTDFQWPGEGGEETRGEFTIFEQSSDDGWANNDGWANSDGWANGGGWANDGQESNAWGISI